MSDGGPAFPWGEHGDCLGGMSLRDYFAGQAILMFDADMFVDEAARRSYLLADAMLDEREKGK